MRFPKFELSNAIAVVLAATRTFQKQASGATSSGALPATYLAAAESPFHGQKGLTGTDGAP